MAEDGGTHTHRGGAFGNGQFEIPAHAHRQLVHADAIGCVLTQAIAQFAHRLRVVMRINRTASLRGHPMDDVLG